MEVVVLPLPAVLPRRGGTDAPARRDRLQNRRGKAAARRFFRRLMKKTGGVPRVIVTDKLRSYRAAHREVMPIPEHRSHKGMNRRAETSVNGP